MADPLGLTWLAGREAAAQALSLRCYRVAGQARALGLHRLADLLEHESDLLHGEASVCRGEAIRIGAVHPENQGACDPEELCCLDCAAAYAVPDEGEAHGCV